METDHLISLIYETVLDASRWPAVLRALAEMTGCVDASLVGAYLAGDKVQGGFGAVGGTIFNVELMSDYLDNYIRWDPMHASMAVMPAGTLVRSDALLTEEQVARNPFFQELLIPNGGRHYAGWIVHKDENMTIGATLHRPDAPLTPQALEQWTGVFRHLGHAAELSARVGPKLAAAQGFRIALEHLGAACLLVDCRARPIESSTAGAKIVTGHGPLQLDLNGSLKCLDAVDTMLFHNYIRAACAGQRGGRFRPNYYGKSIVIDVIPTGVTAENPFGSHPNCALVMVTEHILSKPPAPHAIQKKLGCSRAEAEVAQLLTEGLSPNAIASRRETSLHTVRTQIRSLLAAAGANSVVQLVAILADLRNENPEHPS